MAAEDKSAKFMNSQQLKEWIKANPTSPHDNNTWTVHSNYHARFYDPVIAILESVPWKRAIVLCTGRRAALHTNASVVKHLETVSSTERKENTNVHFCHTWISRKNMQNIYFTRPVPTLVPRPGDMALPIPPAPPRARRIIDDDDHDEHPRATFVEKSINGTRGMICDLIIVQGHSDASFVKYVIEPAMAIVGVRLFTVLNKHDVGGGDGDDGREPVPVVVESSSVVKHGDPIEVPLSGNGGGGIVDYPTAKQLCEWFADHQHENKKKHWRFKSSELQFATVVCNILNYFTKWNNHTTVVICEDRFLAERTCKIALDALKIAYPTATVAVDEISFACAAGGEAGVKFTTMIEVMDGLPFTKYDMCITQGEMHPIIVDKAELWKFECLGTSELSRSEFETADRLSRSELAARIVGSLDSSQPGPTSVRGAAPASTAHPMPGVTCGCLPNKPCCPLHTMPFFRSPLARYARWEVAKAEYEGDAALALEMFDKLVDDKEETHKSLAMAADWIQKRNQRDYDRDHETKSAAAVINKLGYCDGCRESDAFIVAVCIGREPQCSDQACRDCLDGYLKGGRCPVCRGDALDAIRWRQEVAKRKRDAKRAAENHGMPVAAAAASATGPAAMITTADGITHGGSSSARKLAK